MSKPNGRAAESLESALLLISREPAALEALLQHVVPPTRLQQLARSAGSRRPGKLSAASQVGDAVTRSSRMRQDLVQALLDGMPAPGDQEQEASLPSCDELSGARARTLPADERLMALRRHLVDDDPDSWQAACDLLLDWQEWLPPHPQEPPEERPAFAAPERASRAEKKDELLRMARAEISSLEQRLSQERRRKEELHHRLDEALSEARQEHQRAADIKQRLSRLAAVSDREAALEHEASQLRHARGILLQKQELLQEERDDLRGVLEDYDRFFQNTEEEVPSFRDRPLTSHERTLVERLQQRDAQGIAAFRILVVGGGEPQYRHHDKLQEYAEVVGFRGSWRMAEYVSWHKELDTLRNDLQSRFDALVILHWNRTTFTRHAREICHRSGNKPCVTCHYEGFTNLRESLQTCLDQLLSGESRG